MNLCLIPKIHSKAYNVSNGDLLHEYNGRNYFFDFEDNLDPNLQISTTILDQVIQSELSMDSMRAASAGYIVSSASNFVADFGSLLVNAALNSYQTLGDLISSDYACLKWTVTYNGLVSIGRHSWSFSCPLGTQDLILGDDGLLPHPSDHTYTSHSGSTDIVSGAIEDQSDNGSIYIPPQTLTFNDLPAPYFQGSTLVLTWFDHNSTKHYYQITNFTRSLMAMNLSYTSSGATYFFVTNLYPKGQSQSVYLDGTLQNLPFGTGDFRIQTKYGNVIYNGNSNAFDIANANIPSYSINALNAQWNNNWSYLMSVQKGVLQQSLVQGNVPSLWLDASPISTVVNPQDIVIPDDAPLPIEPIVTWPDDNLPDEDPDGDPIEVDPYVPEPINPVVPLPPIPSIVSGNDDLWPDLNDVFDREDDALDFVSLALDWEWPDFSEFLGDYVTSFQWVAAIITALYSGSDLSILFSVLSFFFIAAGMLGIYKWWNK